MPALYEGYTPTKVNANLEVLPHLIPSGRQVDNYPEYARNNATFNILDYALPGETINDGIGDATDALVRAVTAAKSGSSTLSGAPGPSFCGSRIYFPKGRYRLRPSALAFTDVINLKFVGDGSRLFQNYFSGISELVIDGTDTTSSDFGFDFSGQVLNMTRNIQFEDLSVMYMNGFAGDLVRGVFAGWTATRCWFGSDEVHSIRPRTCANLIRFWTGHHYRFYDCNFSDSMTSVLIDNITGSNANDWLFVGCDWYDWGNAAIDCVGTAALGLGILGGGLDPVGTGDVAPYGLRLNVSGFHISGVAFVGSTALKAPSTGWVDVIGGEGSLCGNMFMTQNGPALHGDAGRVEFSNNRVTAKQGVLAEGSLSLRGGGNRYVYFGDDPENTDAAVRLAQVSSSYVDIGPDTFSANPSAEGVKFANSYSMDGGLQRSGMVKYNPELDDTTNGPTYTNERGSVRLISTNVQIFREGSKTLTERDTGKILIPDETAEYILPHAGNLEYTFVKQNAGVGITITCPAVIDRIYGPDGTLVHSISNLTTEAGAMIRLLCITDAITKFWLITAMTGTWTGATP